MFIQISQIHLIHQFICRFARFQSTVSSPSPPMSSLRGLLFLLLTVSLAAAADQPTAYEIIESYGFPQGLLPKGVTRYEIDYSTGKFSLYLDKTCSFTIQGYNLKYKTTITGTVSRNRIYNLNGIQVKLLFLWVNIVEVTKEGDNLELSVGIASAGFPADGFEESPQCGCGFNCASPGESGGGFRFGRLIPLFEV